jgi:hypothetical protein
VTVPTDDQPACGPLSTALPDQVAGAARRPTTPDSPQVAAWGDPAIVLRCGVSRPASYDPTSQVVFVDGISWYAESRGDAMTFTAMNRAVFIDVTVPAAYAPEGNALVDLGGAISAVPSRDE